MRPRPTAESSPVRTRDKSSLVCRAWSFRRKQELALYASDGRTLIFSTALLASKTTRATQGVAVMALKKNAKLVRVRTLADSAIGNQARYRAKSLPAAGALLRQEDTEEQQISLDL